MVFFSYVYRRVTWHWVKLRPPKWMDDLQGTITLIDPWTIVQEYCWSNQKWTLKTITTYQICFMMFWTFHFLFSWPFWDNFVVQSHHFSDVATGSAVLSFKTSFLHRCFIQTSMYTGFSHVSMCFFHVLSIIFPTCPYMFPTFPIIFPSFSHH